MSEAPSVERLTYPSGGLAVDADLALPAAPPPWPAVILIHEVTGTGDHFRDVATRFARQGYAALLPDLYSNDAMYRTFHHSHIAHAMRVRHSREIEAALEEYPAEEREAIRRAVQWDRERDSSTYLSDLLAAIEYLRGRMDVRGDAIGCVGYCWGGGLLGELLVAGAPLNAASIYYGAPPPLAAVGNVRCPIQGHYGTADTVVGYTFVPDLEAAMRANGKDFSAYLYEDAPHAFFNDTGARYRGEAAKLAWERTLEFFDRHLRRVAARAG